MSPNLLDAPDFKAVASEFGEPSEAPEQSQDFKAVAAEFGGTPSEAPPEAPPRGGTRQNPALDTPEGLITPGNISNLYNRPVLDNGDGSVSTTSSSSWDFGGKEVLLPTVVDGKRLTDKEAQDRYRRTGEHLGIFDTPEHADAYANALHDEQLWQMYNGKPESEYFAAVAGESGGEPSEAPPAGHGTVTADFSAIAKQFGGVPSEAPPAPGTTLSMGGKEYTTLPPGSTDLEASVVAGSQPAQQSAGPSTYKLPTPPAPGAPHPLFERQPVTAYSSKTGQAYPSTAVAGSGLGPIVTGPEAIVRGAGELGHELAPSSVAPSQRLGSAKTGGMATEPHIDPAQTKSAVSNIIEGAFQTLSPMAVEAVLAEPVITVIATGGTIAAQQAASEAVRMAGGSPEDQRLAGDVAAAAVAVGGVNLVLRAGRAKLEQVAADARSVKQQAQAFDAANPELAPGYVPPVKNVGRGTSQRLLPPDAETPSSAQPPEPNAPTGGTGTGIKPGDIDTAAAVRDLAENHPESPLAKTAFYGLKQAGWSLEQIKAAVDAHVPAQAEGEGEEPAREYSSTQVQLPSPVATQVRALGEKIQAADLAPNGLETDPHITLKYGGHGDDPEAVRKLIEQEPPITATLGKTKAFPAGDDGVPLIIDVDSPDLHRLNAIVGEALPHTDTFPEYQPHATVAYLKPGTEEKYVGDTSLEGTKVTFDSVTFSAKDGTHTVIPLKGAPSGGLGQQLDEGVSGAQPPAGSSAAPTTETGVEPAKEPETATPAPVPERETWADGRQKPQVGDQVYQVVRGFGGSPAYIHGEVYEAKGGQLRVRTTGSSALIGSAPAGKTYGLDPNWTVQGDPIIKQREDARAAKEKAEKEARDQEHADYVAATHAKAQTQIDAGTHEPLTKETPVGATVVDHWQNGEPAKVVEQSEHGPVLKGESGTDYTIGKADANGTWGGYAVEKAVPDTETGAVNAAPTEKPAEPSVTLPKGVSVTYNPGRHSVEIKFPAKPELETLQKLRTAGYKWAKSTKTWYRSLRVIVGVEKPGERDEQIKAALAKGHELAGGVVSETRHAPVTPPATPPATKPEAEGTRSKAQILQEIQNVEAYIASRDKAGLKPTPLAQHSLTVLRRELAAHPDVTDAELRAMGLPLNEGLTTEGTAPTTEEEPPSARPAPRSGVGTGQLPVSGGGAPRPGRTPGQAPLGAVSPESDEGTEPTGPAGAGHRGPESVVADGVPHTTSAVSGPEAELPSGGGHVPEPVVLPPSGATHDEGHAAPDYDLTPDRIGAIINRGPVTRAEDNLRAIKIVKQLATEQRYATREEQDALAKYVGWGAADMANRLGEYEEYNWSANEKRIWKELRDILTPEERRALQDSSPYAHFTYDLYRPMWEALWAAGFDGGRVLEPSVGTGHAFGLMPPEIRANSTLNGVELEPITAAIASHLYPSARIQAVGYEKARLAKGTQDLIIGNPPFGDFGVRDALSPKFLTDSIINYFFGHALEHARPGGLVMFVASHYMLDNSLTERARRYIMERAEFVGAVRLPNTAFDKSAKTEVVTDIIVLRKLREGEKAQNADAFIQAPKSDTLSTRDYRGRAVNLYRSSWYDLHPELVLGTESNKGEMRGGGPEYTVEAPKGQDLQAALRDALAQIMPPGTYSPRTVEEAERPTRTVVEGSFKPGELRVGANKKSIVKVNTDGSTEDVTPIKTDKDGKVSPDLEAVKKIASMIAIRDARNATIAVMRDPNAMPGDIKTAQSKLTFEYDRFVKPKSKKPNYLNNPGNKRLFKNDPEAENILALETRTAKATITTRKDGKEVLRLSWTVTGKADIFTKRTVGAEPEITHVDTPKDALLTSLGVHGRINWPYMTQIVGMPSNALKKSLVDAGLIFQQPDGSFVLAEEYLSGDVVTKLEDAEAAHEPWLAPNIAALKAIQPAPKTSDDLAAGTVGIALGSHWVPPSDIAAFVGEQLGTGPKSVGYKLSGAEAIVHWDYGANDRAESAAENHPLTVKYAPNAHGKPTKQYTFLELVNDALNLNMPDLGHSEGSGDNRVWVKEPEATLAARANQETLRQMWVQYVFTHEDLQKRLLDIFNTRFNRTVERTFDGSHMKYPGMGVLTNSKGEELHFFPHQNNGVWRVLSSGNTLLAHEVGAGKTFEMIAAAMEMRRTGRAQKPMITVPTYLLAQWKQDVIRLYPNAKLLAFDESDLEKPKRKQAMARIAHGDWDIVLVPHSSFGLLKVSDERMIAVMQEWIDELMAAEREGKDDSPSVKAMARTRRKIQDKVDAKMASLKKEGKDNSLTWEQLGVDALMVDEAQAFKNLFFFSKIDNMRGLSRSESDRSLDLFVKVKDINEQSNYRNLVLATATPVMNSIAEIFTMQRYLQPQTLRRDGVENFDNWYAMFAKALPTTERQPDGNYKEVIRLREYNNLSTLSKTVREVMDYVGWEDMPYLKLPKIKGGRINIVQTEPHPMYPVIMRWFEERMAALKANPPHVDRNGDYIAPDRLDPLTGESMGRPDNILTVMTDAKKAAIDLRLILGNRAQDFPGSRVQVAADMMADYYRRSREHKGVGLMFLDMGTPKEPPPLTFLAGIESEDETEGAFDDEPADDEDALFDDDSVFNLYDTLKAELVKRGVPAREIAYIHSAKNAAERLALFQAANEGRVRFIFASTDKGGVGMNIQTLAGAMFELDAPRNQRPGDLRQRMGRVIRQGNSYIDWGGVEMNRFVTKGTTDEWLWGLLNTKDYQLRKFYRGEASNITEDDPNSMSLEEAQIRSTGDPRGVELTELKGRMARLEAQASTGALAVAAANANVARSTTLRGHYEKDLATLKAWLPTFVTQRGKNFAITVGKTAYDDRKEANAALLSALSALVTENPKRQRYDKNSSPVTQVATIGGVPVYAQDESHLQSIMREKTKEIVELERHVVSVWLDGAVFGGTTMNVGNVGRAEEDKPETFGKGQDIIASVVNEYEQIPHLGAKYQLEIERLTDSLAQSERVLLHPPTAIAELIKARARVTQIETELKAESTAREEALSGPGAIPADASREYLQNMADRLHKRLHDLQQQTLQKGLGQARVDLIQNQHLAAFAQLKEVNERLNPGAAALANDLKGISDDEDDGTPSAQYARKHVDTTGLDVDRKALGQVLGGSLYSQSNPSTAVKEMVQNGADAVKDRPDGHVEVYIHQNQRYDDDSGGYVEVRDNGSGMTVQQLKDYFLTLGGSGKRANTTASGGFGLASSSPLLGGAKIALTTTVATGKGGILGLGGTKLQRFSFEGTPDDILDRKLKIYEDDVPAGATTGTHIRVYYKAGVPLKAYEIEDFLQKSAASTAIPKLTLYEDSYRSGANRVDDDGLNTPAGLTVKDLGATPKFDTFPKTYVFGVKGAEVAVYAEPIEEDPKFGVPFHLYNNGLYQLRGASSHGTFSKLPNLPERFHVDIKPTVPEGDAAYPFTANRETLNKAFEAELQAGLTKHLKPYVDAYRAMIAKSFSETPSIGDSDVKVFDFKGRITPADVEALGSDRIVEMFSQIVGVGRDIIGAIYPEKQEQVTHLGILLSGDHNGGVRLKSGLTSRSKMGVYVNPFASLQFLSATATPRDLGNGIYHLLLHEITHLEADTEGAAFTWEFYKNDTRIGEAQRAAFVQRITEAVSDPSTATGRSEAFSRAYAIYQDITGREGGRTSALVEGASGLHRPADEPGGETVLPDATEQRRESSGPRSVSLADLARLAAAKGTTVDVQRARAEAAGYTVTSETPTSSFTTGPEGPTLQATILPGAAELGEYVLEPAVAAIAKAVKTDHNLLLGALAPAKVGVAPRAAGNVRAQTSARDQRMGRAKKTLIGIERMMDTWSHDESQRFWDVMEGLAPDTTIPLAQREIATLFRQILDRWRDQLLDHDLLDHYLEYYWPHEWVQPGQGLNFIRRLFGRKPIQGPEAFRKKRTIPTTREGLAADLEPVSWNPATQLLRKITEMNRSLAGRGIHADMKRDGLYFYRAVGKALPDEIKHWEQVPDFALGTVYGPRVPEQTFGRVIAGHYYAPPEVIRLIRNHLSPGLMGKSMTFDAFRSANNFLNQLQLGFSGFHAYMTMTESVVSKLALTLEYASRGQWAKAAQVGVEVPFAPIVDVVRGHADMKEFYKTDADADMIDGIVGQVIQAGGGFGWSMLEHGGAPEKFMRDLRAGYGAATRGELGTVAGRGAHAAAVAIPAAVEVMMKPIMEGLVPRLKMAAFRQRAAMEIERLGPDADLNTLRRVLGEAWDSIDNRFGEMRYDNLFWDNRFKQFAMAMVRAVGWNVGTIREMMLAPTSQMGRIKHNVRVLTGGAGGAGGQPPTGGTTAPGAAGAPWDGRLEPWLHPRMAWFIAMLLVHGMMAAMLMYLLTGEWPSEIHDWAYPPDGTVDPSGRKRRISLIDYAKDLFAWTEHAGQTAAHKLSPLLTLAYELIDNEDYYGVEIRAPEDSVGQQIVDSFLFLEDQYKPFTWVNADRRGGEANTAAEKAVRFVKQALTPYTPAPASLERSDAETLLHAWGERDHRVKTKEEAAKGVLTRSIREGYSSRTPEAMDAAQAAKQSGDLSRRQIQAAERAGSRHQTYLEYGFTHQTFPNALTLYEAATPEERATLRPLLLKKARDAMKSMAPNEWQATWTRYQDDYRLPTSSTP